MYVESIKVNFNAWIKPEPIMLIVLPIIPSKTSQNFYSYCYIIPMPSSIIPTLFFLRLLCE